MRDFFWHSRRALSSTHAHAGLAPPEADLDPDDLRCRLTKADCDALGEWDREETPCAGRVASARSLSLQPSPLFRVTHPLSPASSATVRAHLADPAVRAAAARVLAAPPAATEPVLDAELSAAGALGGLGAAVLEQLAPDEACLLPPPRGGGQ